MGVVVAEPVGSLVYGLVGRDRGWLAALLVGAGINGLLTLTGIGSIVSFGVGAVGFGAVLRDRAE
jgi:hypothetical protein